MLDKQSFGKRLQEAITTLNITGNQFSDILKQSSSKIYKILRGDNAPSVEFLMLIHEHFEMINMDYMITGRGRLMLVEEEAIETYQMTKEPKVLEDNSPRYLNYKELYEQCRAHEHTKELVITLQREKINALEAQIKAKGE